MAHGVIRTDRMLGTDAAPALVSLRYMGSGTTATDIDNGCVVLLDGLMTGEREIYKAKTPAAGSDLGDIVVVASDETMYDERNKNLDEFYNKAGKTARGYRLHKGDIFSVTADVLTGSDITKGDIVELQADVKLKVVGSLTQDSTQVGVIADINQVGRYTYYAIEVK